MFCLINLASVSSLSSLSTSIGSISPSFETTQTYYTLQVSNSITSIAIIATPTSVSGTTMNVNGKQTSFGVNSDSQSLLVGDNNITIIVTAQDGVSSTTYVIAVNRQKCNIFFFLLLLF